MKRIIYQVDSFTNKPFKGNPAGVMILDKAIGKKLMQNIAKEMNLSETAFVLKNKDFFRIRFFTPTTEIDLCGHATLASAHILYESNVVQENTEIIFKANKNKLFVNKQKDWIKMKLPRFYIKEYKIPKSFKNLVGFDPKEMYLSNYNFKVAYTENEEDVFNAKPNFEELSNNDLGELIITAPSKNKNTDFVVRCFAPDSGINEDPVTGSAHCALAPLWNKLTGKKQFNSLQVSERTGRLKVVLNKNNVEISGQAITIFKADIVL